MKRTLKRESKSAWNCREGSGWGPAMRPGRTRNGFGWSADRLGARTVVGCAGGLSPGASGASGRRRRRGRLPRAARRAPRGTAPQRPVGSPSDPSWNTDQGVWHACESTGSETWDAQGNWLDGRPSRAAPPADPDLLWRVRVGARLSGPERWWTMPERGEARGNSGGGSKRYWRANRSSDLGIGAKD